MNHLWLWPIAGGGVGLANALTRWKTVSLMAAGTGTRSMVLGLVVGGVLVRLGLVAGLLMAGLRQGIVPGMLAFGGLWLTRSAIVIWISLQKSRTYQRITEQVWS